MRIETLERGDAAEFPAAVPGGGFKLEKRDIAWRSSGGARRDFRPDRAAVAHFPGRACVVPANRFFIDEQCRDWLAKLPRELAGRIRFALVDLRSHCVSRYNQGFPRRGNGTGHLGCRRKRDQSQSKNICRDYRDASRQRTRDTAQLSEKLGTGLGAAAEYFLPIAIGLAAGAIDLHARLLWIPASDQCALWPLNALSPA